MPTPGSLVTMVKFHAEQEEKSKGTSWPDITASVRCSGGLGFDCCETSIAHTLTSLRPYLFWPIPIRFFSSARRTDLARSLDARVEATWCVSRARSLAGPLHDDPISAAEPPPFAVIVSCATDQDAVSGAGIGTCGVGSTAVVLAASLVVWGLGGGASSDGRTGVGYQIPCPPNSTTCGSWQDSSTKGTTEERSSWANGTLCGMPRGRSHRTLGTLRDLRKGSVK